jgi:hypothetical protein
MTYARLALCFSLVMGAGCPAEDDTGDPVGTTGSGEESETEAGTAPTPITAGDCPGVAMACDAEACCAGLECVEGVCENPSSCLETGETCSDDAECCGGLCRSDGVCGPFECVPEGGSCEDASCCDELPCDQNTLLCSSTCAQFEEACEVDEDCCEQACIDNACGVLG